MRRGIVGKLVAEARGSLVGGRRLVGRVAGIEEGIVGVAGGGSMIVQLLVIEGRY